MQNRSYNIESLYDKETLQKMSEYHKLIKNYKKIESTTMIYHNGKFMPMT